MISAKIQRMFIHKVKQELEINYLIFLRKSVRILAIAATLLYPSPSLCITNKNSVKMQIYVLKVPMLKTTRHLNKTGLQVSNLI